MGTTFRTPQDKFEYQWRKQHSTVSCVVLALRYKEAFSWETGLTIIKLKDEVEKRKGKPLCKQTIYDAISLINRYGKNTGVYIRSGIGSTITNNKPKNEHRYFIPKESKDIIDEKIDLEKKRERIMLKEEHIEFHEIQTIPQEKEHQAIRQI